MKSTHGFGSVKYSDVMFQLATVPKTALTPLTSANFDSALQ
jgi:hypothetical protein